MVRTLLPRRHLSSTHGDWRIALRVVVIDVGADAPARPAPNRIAQPRQDRSDPSYQRPLEPVPAVDPVAGPLLGDGLAKE